MAKQLNARNRWQERGKIDDTYERTRLADRSSRSYLTTQLARSWIAKQVASPSTKPHDTSLLANLCDHLSRRDKQAGASATNY